MTGSIWNVRTVTASGDARIDGILHNVAWADATLYYSVPQTAFEYGQFYGSGEQGGFFPVTNAMGAVADFALAQYGTAADGFSIEGFTSLNVQYTTFANAQIRIAQTTSDPFNIGTAWGYYPDTSQVAGDVWFTNTQNDFTAPVAGSYAYTTVMHEIGHAMGLFHGHETGSFGALPSQYDTMEYSIMTYRSYEGANTTDGYQNETWGYAQSWMMQDIAALQYMYGADFTTNSGDTTYSWNPNSGNTLVNGVAAITPGANRIFATIWDGGGTDTYDLSAYTTDLEIDLRPGEHSVFSTGQLAELGTNVDASGNIYNALQYQGDVRSLVENAIGGSGDDTIRGNQADNNLRGNGGNDNLLGFSGQDFLQGLAGRDFLNGGAGSDVMNSGGDNDFLRGGAGGDTMRGAAGNDRMYGDGGGDQMYGGGENDRMFGGNGMDILRGEDGNDELFGGNGRDILIGGEDVDEMTGGSGRDVFQFNDVSDSPTGGLSDQILDFTIGLDRIDLSRLNGPALTLNIGGSFTGTGASAITREVSGDTLVFADINGNGSADFRLIVDGTLGLTASDFFL